MKIKIKHYDRPKYDPASRMDWETEVEGVRCTEVITSDTMGYLATRRVDMFTGKPADVEADGENRYVVLYLPHGEMRVYPVERVDIFHTVAEIQVV